MTDLMLHVLDVAMNSVTAGATTVRISIHERLAADELCLYVADNGPGMSATMVQRVLEEFATTKSKQKGWVGFGLALLRGTVELCEGEFAVQSREGVGTLVSATLAHAHPDRPPLGSVADSLQTLLVGVRGVDFCITHRVDDDGYRLDTRPVRRMLGADFGTRAVRGWLVDQLRQGEDALAARRGNR